MNISSEKEDINIQIIRILVRNGQQPTRKNIKRAKTENTLVELIIEIAIGDEVCIKRHKIKGKRLWSTNNDLTTYNHLS